MQYQSWYITGASSGIGEAFAKEAPKNARLLLSGQNQERLQSLTHELGERAKCLAGDLTLAAEREAAILAAEEAQVDMLVLNAGIGQLGPVLQNPPKREMEMMMLNMVAPVEMVRALAPGMIERARISGKKAGIIFVSSVAAFLPLPYFATYSATKTFLKNFGEAFSCELRGEPIDCLVLCPGTTRTRFFERADAQKVLTGSRTAPPEKVAKEAMAALGKASVHVVGWDNRFLAFALGILPRRLTLRASTFFMKSRLL